MLFKDAVELLKSGKCIVRECWKEEHGYLVLMPKMQYVWRILFNPNPNAGSFSFSIDEMDANDWIEYLEPKKEIEGELCANAS